MEKAGAAIVGAGRGRGRVGASAGIVMGGGCDVGVYREKTEAELRTMRRVEAGKIERRKKAIDRAKDELWKSERELGWIEQELREREVARKGNRA